MSIDASPKRFARRMSNMRGSNELTGDLDGRSLRTVFNAGSVTGASKVAVPLRRCKGFVPKQASSRHTWRAEALYARADELFGACLPALTRSASILGPGSGLGQRSREGRH